MHPATLVDYFAFYHYHSTEQWSHTLLMLCVSWRLKMNIWCRERTQYFFAFEVLTLQFLQLEPDGSFQHKKTTQMNFKSSRWSSDYLKFCLMPFHPLPHRWLHPSPLALAFSLCVFLQRNCLFTWAKNKSCDWERPTVPFMHYLWTCFLFFHFLLRAAVSE